MRRSQCRPPAVGVDVRNVQKPRSGERFFRRSAAHQLRLSANHGLAAEATFFRR
jgi:hypothetical protein